jgi:hypothetical protein
VIEAKLQLSSDSSFLGPDPDPSSVVDPGFHPGFLGTSKSSHQDQPQCLSFSFLFAQRGCRPWRKSDESLCEAPGPVWPRADAQSQDSMSLFSALTLALHWGPLEGQ